MAGRPSGLSMADSTTFGIARWLGVCSVFARVACTSIRSLILVQFSAMCRLAQLMRRSQPVRQRTILRRARRGSI
jgi:hypothetical protein